MWSETSGQYSNLWPPRQHNSVPSYDGPDTHWRSLDLVFVLEQLRCDMALDISINPFLWSGHFLIAFWLLGTIPPSEGLGLLDWPTLADWWSQLGLRRILGISPRFWWAFGWDPSCELEWMCTWGFTPVYPYVAILHVPILDLNFLKTFRKWSTWRDTSSIFGERQKWIQPSTSQYPY